MIPPFTESGVLPRGLHLATLNEIVDRFGQSSEIRQVQMDSIRWMVDLAFRAGIRRIVLNGSFTTDILEPNDVDCVLLLEPGTHRNPEALQELRQGLPFLSIAIVGLSQFDNLVHYFFATDRSGEPKGMVEVLP